MERLILGKGGRSVLKEHPGMIPRLWSGAPEKEARNRGTGEEQRVGDKAQPDSVGVYFALPVGLFICLTDTYQMLTEPGRLSVGGWTHTMGTSTCKSHSSGLNKQERQK